MNESNNMELRESAKALISHYFFSEAEKHGLQVNEIALTIEPNYEDENYIDLVISDLYWTELAKYKIRTVL